MFPYPMGKLKLLINERNFKPQQAQQRLAKSQKKASLKPLLTYRLDNKSSLDKLKGKIYYENKKKAVLRNAELRNLSLS